MNAKATAVFALLFLAFGALASPAPITIPAGTPVHFKLNETINTATAKGGTRVSGELTQPIVVNGKTIANEGAAVSVKITNAEASGRIGGSAHLTFHVASIKLANGQRIDVSTSSYSREGKAHAKHNATYIATAGVVGALAGQAIGGNRNSTAKGAAIGAGVGIGAAAATGKFDFEEKAGTHYNLKLKNSVTVTM